MREMKKLVLDADAPEYSGKLNDVEIWQVYAYQSAIKNISSLIRESKKIMNYYKETNTKSILRIHDAIFVSGGRGTGKSVFLYNLKSVWQSADFKNKEGKTEFLDVIDPTLLIDHDNFVNVVIAHIHSHMQNVGINNKQQYHRLLGDLAESLGQTEYNLRDIGGLDRIISYQSSIDLELNFHKYLDFCCESIGVDVLVLPIDDVDMALSKAHDVLETIRRLLSCPRIIPVVSGDRAVYLQILKDYFKFGANNNYEMRELFSSENNKSEYSEKQYWRTNNDYPEHLAKQYWRKVFPEHLTIAMQEIKYLLPKIDIYSNNRLPITPKQLLKKVHRLTSPLVNGIENSYIINEPDTSRKLVQFTKNFIQYYDLKSEEKNENNFWNDFIRYTENYGIGQGYLVSDAEIRINNESEVISLKDLPLFNVKLQNQIAEYNNIFKSKAYLDDLLLDLEPILGSKNTSKLTGWQKSQLEAIESQQEKINKSIVPMPPIEVYKYGYSVSYNLINSHRKENLNDVGVCLLIDLYTHDDFYGTGRNTAKQVFFGKAFELFALSMIYDCSNKQRCEEIIGIVLASKPLNSIYNVAPTKTFDFSSEQLESNKESDTSNTNTKNRHDDFITSLIEWENEYNEVLQSARSSGLCHLLSVTYNKVFSQLHQMRVSNIFGYNTATPDSLFHIATRFEFVLLSSIGAFLKGNNEVALQNTAVTDNNKYLMTDGGKNSDRAYKLNVIDFIKDETISNNKLMCAIKDHPIFKLTEGYDDLDGDVIKAISLLAKDNNVDISPQKAKRSNKRANLKVKQIYKMSATEDGSIELFQTYTPSGLKQALKNTFSEDTINKIISNVYGFIINVDADELAMDNNGYSRRLTAYSNVLS